MRERENILNKNFVRSIFFKKALKILLKSSDIDVKFIDKIQVEWHNQLEKRVKEKFISLNLASQKGIFK